MPYCSSCGSPDYLNCGHYFSEPYCDQCDQNDNCNSEMDSACVIYRPTYPNQTPPVSQLINLGLPIGSSAQLIFDAIDARLGPSSGGGITPVVSESVLLTASGPNNRSLRADIIQSVDAGNILTVHSNGVYVANPNPNYLVKVDSASAPDYLFNQLTGDTNGCVSIDILDVDGQVLIRPTFDLDCFSTALCAAGTGTKNQIANCLLSTGLQAIDTPSVHLNLSTATPNVLTANVKVSAAGGNNIIINSDGIYSSGGTAESANNGLSVSGSNIQLGGALIKNTVISFASGAFGLQFSSNPSLYVGDASPAGNTPLQVDNVFGTTAKDLGIIGTTTTTLAAHGAVGVNGNLAITSGTDTDTSVKGGVYGQILFEGAATLNSAAEVVYGGVSGLITKFGTGNISSGSVVAGGAFIGFVADSGNVPAWAAILAKGIYQAPQGASYTGTVTDYYGLYIEDIASSGFGSRVTNKHAIFQEGSTMTNSFATAVVVTSDERVKTDFESYTRGLAEIEQIDTLKFHFKGFTEDKKRVGVIAQAIEKVIPEAVITEKSNYYKIDDFKKLDTDTLIFTLINAVKELSAKVKALEVK